MRGRSGVRWAAALLGAGLLAGGWWVVGSWAATHSSCSQRPHLSERRILRIALRAAASAGDRRPALIQHGQGTRRKANRLASGDIVPGCRWSYLIAERGHFVLRDAHTPPGAPPPSGRVLTLVVDAATTRVTDFGVSNRYPKLSGLGRVTTDLRRRRASHSHQRGGVTLIGRHLPAPRAGSFISLVPACGCALHTALLQFSSSDGRRLGTFARVSTDRGRVMVSDPHPTPRGSLLLTFSSGPRCKGPSRSFGLCYPVKDSCSSRIVKVQPRSGTVSQLLSFPASRLITSAVPSPRGHLLLMAAAPCQRPTKHYLVVRDLASGRQWSIGADVPRCTGIGPAAWSLDGSDLVFPYARLIPTQTPAGPEFCTGTFPAGLVVASAKRPSNSSSWKPIKPDRGCSFLYAVFDPTGIAAVEGCKPGNPRLGSS